MASILFALLLTAAAAAPNQIWNLTLLENEAAALGAVCLDGSPGAYYLTKGAESAKFYLHQQGGGW